MRAALASLTLVAQLLLAPGCEKAKPQLGLDLSSLGDGIVARETQVFASPKTNAAMDDALAAIGREPAVTASAGKLFAQLEEDPKLVAAGQAVIGKLSESPDMQAYVTRVMAEHPGATPDQIGELVGAQFGNVMDLPEVSPAFSAAFDELVDKIHPQGRFGAAIARTTTRLDAYLTEPARVDRWASRLRELNGGAEPDGARATQLYLDHAWSQDRIRAFVIKLLGTPAVRTEIALTLSDVLALPGVSDQLRAAASAVAVDPAEQAAALRFMLLLTHKPLVTAELKAQLSAILGAPVMTSNVDKLITALLADPKIGDAVSAHFEKLVADPVVRAEFDDLIDRW